MEACKGSKPAHHANLTVRLFPPQLPDPTSPRLILGPPSPLPPQMPYLLTPEAKSKILRGEAMAQQHNTMATATMQARRQGWAQRRFDGTAGLLLGFGAAAAAGQHSALHPGRHAGRWPTGQALRGTSPAAAVL